MNGKSQSLPQQQPSTASSSALTYFLGRLMPDEVQLIVETELVLQA